MDALKLDTFDVSVEVQRIVSSYERFEDSSYDGGKTISGVISGTGHAVQQAMPGIPETADVLVLYGDTPLLDADVLRRLVDEPADGLKVLTMKVPDPAGYGRIVRDEAGNVTGIVEERDATDEQKTIEKSGFISKYKLIDFKTNN